MALLCVTTYENNKASALDSTKLNLSANGARETEYWANLPPQKCREATSSCTNECQPDGWCSRNGTNGNSINILLEIYSSLSIFRVSTFVS